MPSRLLNTVLFLIIALTFTGLIGFFHTPSQGKQASAIEWHDWSDEVFAQAKAENKFVLLDLEAIWCHWCHVMDEKTYSDPEVIALLNEHYIAVKVDQDSKPDLASRYIDYAWPATVIYNANGDEIVKRAGFIQPTRMRNLLQAIIEDPSPEHIASLPKASSTNTHQGLPAGLREELHQRYLESYDTQHATWGIGRNKFLDWDSEEYAMAKSMAGDTALDVMAKDSLNANIALLDPVWGGIYQYSHGGTWDNPHFEKIMSVQAENLRLYALGYRLWKDPTYLNVAVDIHDYLSTFLKGDNGAFYTSQDADVVQGKHSAHYFDLNDAQRRKQGIPHVDTHQYARENGWVIQGLVGLYKATGDDTYLQEALTAAQWIVANRSLPTGGFSHDAHDNGGPYLGDNVAMGRASLALYEATGDRLWLTRAIDTADFIDANFKDPDGAVGYLSAVSKGTLKVTRPHPNRDENMKLARFSNLLHHYTGKASYEAMAQNAMGYVAIPRVANRQFTSTPLLADLEITQDPLHMTIVGSKQDPKAKALYQAALSYPTTYVRIEWLDRDEGPLPNADVAYPTLSKAAAFVCTDSRCSVPLYNPNSLHRRVDRIRGKKAAPTIPTLQ